MAKCKHKHGLLILRECGREAVTRCENCGKPICEEHKTQHNEYTVCYDCKSAPLSDASNVDGYTRQAYRRNFYYGAVGYDPFYSRRYRDVDYYDGDYDDRDYDTFDDDASAMGYDDFGDDLSEDNFSDS